MRIYVGNTDPSWYSFLSNYQIDSEVNFWRPSGLPVNFRAINEGDLFFLRLRNPVNKIVGFGRFALHRVFPLAKVWDIFEQNNGCASLHELVALIAQHRHVAPDLRVALNWDVGCTVLNDVEYYPEHEWQDFRFAPGVMVGKSLDVAEPDGAYIWDHMQKISTEKSWYVPATTPGTTADTGEIAEQPYGLALTKTRPHQRTFRMRVIDAYGRRCSVTGERTLPVVEAAHIKPYAKSGSDLISNGIALREDIHTLFDKGYVALDEARHFIVSPRLREDFENGREYYKFHCKQIAVPKGPNLGPDPNVIRWHLDNIYVG